MSGAARAASPFVLHAGTYVALGLAPFPVQRAGKRPLVPWRPLVGKRLIDEHSFEALDRYVLAWWDKPEPPNIGIPTGVEIFLDGQNTAPLLVLDLDDDAAAERVRAAVTRPTPAVRTPRGGLHLWYVHRGDSSNRARVGGLGLDVRGLGGYVVAPPSVGANGRSYEWVASPGEVWPPAPLPEALVGLIWPRGKPRVAIRRPPRRDAGRYVEAALRREAERVASAREGERNATLNDAAFRLARFLGTGQLGERELTDAMLEAAGRAGLPEREAAATIASAIRGRQAS